MLDFLLMKLVQLSVDTIPAQLLRQIKNPTAVCWAIVTVTDKNPGPRRRGLFRSGHRAFCWSENSKRRRRTARNSGP